MSSASDRPFIALLLGAACACAHGASGSVALAPARTGHAALSPLRVCADPNNLPYSNRAEAGFENALAELVAKDLDRAVAYTWWPQRRGFIRNTLASRRCDVVVGLPAGYRMALTTAPYYRSSYVFVTRADRHLDIASLDDPRLRHLRIGLHTIGDDYHNVPPAKALAARGIVGNIAGYSIYGDYSRPDPPRDLIDAVARGDIDVAIAWGPIAGYFAAHEDTPLDVHVLSRTKASDPPMTFSIAMGVRRDDAALRATLDSVLARHQVEIKDLLRRFDVPLLAPAGASTATGG